ncbi:GDSL-type esterase/lipase family protein [Microbulbifer sp. TB1203]|nr:GDSL-type esterase/lipase family protein [Microbulbifer sp. TB1203]
MTITNDWGSGFQAEVTVTNDGTTTLSNWTAEFDMPVEIGSIWNGEVQSSDGEHFAIGPAGWNAEIAPGGSTSFGFTATPGNVPAASVTVRGDGGTGSSSSSSSSSSTSSSSSSSSSSGGCAPTAITPYASVDGGSWQETSSLTLSAGSTVELGPHPTSGSWSWNGCGTSGSSREQTVSPNSSCTATATYTNSCGAQSTQDFSLTVESSQATEIVIEENTTGFCRVDGSVDNNNDGFTGTGFANTDNATGTGVNWQIEVSQAGTYSLQWRYANGGANGRPGDVLIDGQTQFYGVAFAVTDGWTTWANSETIELWLEQGTHTIRLQATTADGLGNIDSLSITGNSGISANECGSSDAITLWMAGDSTVMNGGSSCPHGWGRDFASYFNGNVSVQNLAVGGRSVRTWLYDVQSSVGSDGECILNTDSSGNPILQNRWQTTLSGMKNGDYLFIQFGINDGSSTCPRHVGSNAFMEAYQMMAEAARARGATPIFITPVSAIRCSGSTAVATRGFLSETINLGASLGVPVIDLHQRSIQLYNERGFCPIPGGGDVSESTGGAVGAFFCNDHTHFDTSGAYDIAGLVVQGLRDLNIPLAQHLKVDTSTPVNVFLAGDSIVSSYTDTSSPNDMAGWGQMLPEQYNANVNVYNHAVGGRTARRFIDEGRLDAIWAEANAGDYLLVQFGTNDGHRTATYTINGQTIPYYLDPDTDFKSYLSQYINGARARGINLGFVTPTPRNSAYCTGGNGTGRWAQAMRELASAEGIPLIDLNRKTVDHLTAICPSPTPEDFFFVRADGSIDGTHFQENGARNLARFVADGIGEAGMVLDNYRK